MPADATLDRFGPRHKGEPTRASLEDVPRCALALAAFVAAVVVAPVGATTSTGTLRGTVVSGPARPVCIEGTPCTAPAVGVVLQFVRAGRVVARTTTGAGGRYRITLGRGRYAVRVERRTALQSIAPATVTVLPGRVSRVDFEIDTGLQ